MTLLTGMFNVQLGMVRRGGHFIGRIEDIVPGQSEYNKLETSSPMIIYLKVIRNTL